MRSRTSNDDMGKYSCTARLWLGTASVSKMFISPREVVPSNVVNDQDQGGLIAIAAALSLIITGMFFCIRLFIRWPWRKLFRTDDSVALVASVRGVSIP